MKKLAVFLIFSFLIMLSLQQAVFAQIEGEEERKKAAEEAANAMKREIPDKNEEDKIEAEEVKEKEVRKKASELIKLLPTEDKLEEITFRTIWKYADKQSNLDEEVGIETTTAILRDITRVYDPILNKYKVPTILIEIIKYDDIYELEYYWEEISSSSIEDIFNNAYLAGSPSKNIDCMFNFSAEGAVTLCITDEYVVESIIYDKYQEHFNYNKLKIGPKKLQINQDEMTINIAQEILKNIEKKKGIESDYQLFKILESNQKIKDKEIVTKENMERTLKENNIKNKNKSLGIEKDKKYGIQNFSCIKDEFGLVTISGQFNNNQIKKDKVVVEILFLNNEQNIILKNTANLRDIDEFETKRFLGNTKIDQSFLTCTIQLVN
jgi:hypothetical protein